MHIWVILTDTNLNRITDTDLNKMTITPKLNALIYIDVDGTPNASTLNVSICFMLTFMDTDLVSNMAVFFNIFISNQKEKQTLS